MKIIAITSNHLRHKYVINQLIKNFEILAIFAEEKAFDPYKDIENDDEQRLIKKHFKKREETEIKYFGDNTYFNLGPEKVHYLKRGEINESKIVEKIKKLSPDAIVVYGSGILKQPIINIIPNKIINIHLGLSPYYRGSGTNFWPFVNEEPEFAGVTIHHIDEGVDTGRIIHQCYAPIEKGDNFHDIGCKTIILAAELIIKTLNELKNKTLSPGVKQHEKGRLYLRKHFNANAVRKLYKLFEEGLVERYILELKTGKRKLPKIIK